MEYKIVYAETTEALEAKINVLVSSGWRPQGGIAISQDIMFQAVIRN